MLPNFIVIGAAKCGTTSLCSLLSTHPEIFFSNPKEVHYFGWQSFPAKSYDWYVNHFDEAEEKAVGEGSTSCTRPDKTVKAAQEIRSLIPGCKLIFIARNPITRIESDWKMRRYEEWAAPSINTAITAQQSLVGLCRYWSNLAPYRELFPADQLLVLFLEDMARDPQSELKKCFKFLGVDPDVQLPGLGVKNSSDSRRRRGSIAQLLSRYDIIDRIRSRLPKSINNFGKRLLTSSFDEEPDWMQDHKAYIANELRDDVGKFLQAYGKPADFWDTEDTKFS